jgi:cation:H+ antiporter
VSSALDVGSLILGIAILYWGAEWLIRGSAGIARAIGVTPLVVGLTVVAYGTAAPELAVATKTALAGHTPIALGTVIGSCAANIALVLGLAALISPPTVDGRIIRREIPVLVGSAIVVPILFRNGVLSRFEGLFLVGCAVVFTMGTIAVAARLDLDEDLEQLAESAASSSSAIRAGQAAGGGARPRTSRLLALVMTAFGLVLLVLGATLLVNGGRGIAQQLGMSERMLGLTIVALGTALPELIRAVVAAARGQAAVAVGTVISSNLLSVFLVLGVTACLQPIRLGERMHLVDLLGLVAITLLGVLVMRGSRRITRFEGALLVLAYIAFLVCAALL